MKSKINFALLTLLFGFSNSIFSQELQQNVVMNSTDTYTVLRYTLLGTIFLLLIIVIALAYLTNSIAIIYFRKWKENVVEKNKGKIVPIALLLVSLCSMKMQAQSTLQPITNSLDWANMPVDLYMMMFTILVEAIIIYGLVTSIFRMLRQTSTELPEFVTNPKPEKTFFQTINQTVPIEEEYKLDLSHDYDGIRELDNKVPSWWLIAFYSSIVFGCIYMIRMYGTKTLPSQLVELENENKVAAVQKAEYLKLTANNVDENSVQLSDVSGVNAGKEIYMNNCVACHGNAGQGTVGPNLTDEYWLHKGGLKDVFYSIKYGWAEKGMKSWKDDFSPLQIAQLASYVTTLKGTNPPNPKEKQGELYNENSGVSLKDSTSAAKVDSVKM